MIADGSMKVKPCLLIPVYNHPLTITPLVESVLGCGLLIILVDDGCDDECRRVLGNIASRYENVCLTVLEENRGKGGAVKAGLFAAKTLGYTHAIQIDADGQHNVDDIPAFMSMLAKHPDILISGLPVYDSSVPKVRYYGRYLTHVWVWINTLSLTIRDSMCGFRAYPVEASCRLIEEVRIGDRMDFDTEFMVRWWWSGGDVVQIKTKVKYPDDGISHFDNLKDNWLISKMHARLFFGMLIRIPGLLMRKFSGARR